MDQKNTSNNQNTLSEIGQVEPRTLIEAREKSAGLTFDAPLRNHDQPFPRMPLMNQPSP